MITAQQFVSSLRALSKHDNLSYLTNSTGELYSQCLEFVRGSRGDVQQSGMLALCRVMLDRGYGLDALDRFKSQTRRGKWDDPTDGISFPPTFS